MFGSDPREVAAETSVELVRAVAAQRSIKEAREIDEIEDAGRNGGMYAADHVRGGGGRTEAEIAAIHTAEAVAAGCEQAFSPIVTVRGEVLHNIRYENILEEG